MVSGRNGRRLGAARPTASGSLLVVALLSASGGSACGSGATTPSLTAKEKGQNEFEAMQAAFGVLETLAGAGRLADDVNEWLPSYEGGPAIAAELSSPHTAVGDAAGNVFIADKEGHGIRKVTPDGLILTVAGVSQPGDDGDAPGPANLSHLDWPNGLWVGRSGNLYILDLGNFKIRKVDTSGHMTTLFVAPTLQGGRGLWVAEDESLAYVSSLGQVLRWTPAGGVETFSTGYTDLGNLFVDGTGTLFVTDRGQHRVFKVAANGVATPIAGTGSVGVVADGMPALETPLTEVRGIWGHPSGGFFLGLHRGSRVMYLDSFGFVHLLIEGGHNSHCCDGTPLTDYSLKISEVRNVTLTPAGDLLVTEHDAGYVRIVRHAP